MRLQPGCVRLQGGVVVVVGGAGGGQACSEGGACVPRHTKSERRAAWRSTKTSFESRYSGRATTCTREIYGDIGEIWGRYSCSGRATTCTGEIYGEIGEI